jgi:hypothetical protein
MIVEKRSGCDRARIGTLYLPKANWQSLDYAPEKPSISIASPGKAIINYSLWIGVVVVGSITLCDLNSHPARIARQNNLDAYARPASVALITRHCRICNEP